MTLDETIKEFTDWAKDNRKEQNFWAAERDENDEINPLSYADCEGLARDAETRAEYHEQLAEWLTELKDLREENITLKNDNERLRDCVDSCVHNGELDYAELAEAKRLLKAAVEDFSNIYDHIFDCDGMCDTCPIHGERDNCLVWRYADEALKLIES